MPSSRTQPSAGAFDGLVIRRDRVAVALLGAACLALAVITGLLAPFTAVSWPWPVFLLLLSAGSLAALVYLADQERAAGALPAAEPAEGRGRAVIETSVSEQETIEDQLFDHEEHVARDTGLREQRDRRDLDLPDDRQFMDDLRFEDEQEPAIRRAPAAQYIPPRTGAHPADSRRAVAAQSAPTHEELRAVARRVAQQSSQGRGESWEPITVPKPTYTRAAVAPRRAPEPLQSPSAPKSSGRPLQEAAQAPQPEPRTGSASLDLDDVLSRRRA
ncbi:hypothetical protein [Kocuria palustris]|uniref:hypothetical protein n=1 Tax=Kocuria palustris TaxID=71999 RepID=UPI00119EA1DF|nr:hypothetical protein [Kocuria palustris]